MTTHLLMVYNDLSHRWLDVFNRDQSLAENLGTIQEAKKYVTKYYSNLLGNFSFLDSETELHVVSELDIPCINC